MGQSLSTFGSICLLLFAVFCPAPSMGQTATPDPAGRIPMRLERVPTPPPFDLSRQPRATEMPAAPPPAVERVPDASAQQTPVEPLPLPPDRSRDNASGGLWRERTVTPAESFSIPRVKAQGEAKENASVPPISGPVDFSDLKPGGRARVKAIIDPLTLQLGNGKILQLAGIDAPDMDPHQPGDFAIAGRDALENLVAGKELTLHVSQDKNRGRTNRLGHVLAQVEVAGGTDSGPVWVQGALLERGLVRVRPGADSLEMAVPMLAAEARARAAGAGLWARPDYAILSPDAAKGKVGSFQIVEGTVIDVATVRNTIYLNFGKNWRTDFSGGLSAAARTAFARAGLKPMEWQGRRVRLRGFVEERNGPYIAIDAPGQVEFPDGPPPRDTGSAAPPLPSGPARPSVARPAAPATLQGLRHIQVKAPFVPPASTQDKPTESPSGASPGSGKGKEEAGGGAALVP